MAFPGMGKKFAMLLRREFEIEQGMCLACGKDAAQLQAEGAGSSLEEYLGASARKILYMYL